MAHFNLKPSKITSDQYLWQELDDLNRFHSAFALVEGVTWLRKVILYESAMHVYFPTSSLGECKVHAQEEGASGEDMIRSHFHIDPKA